MIDYDGMSNDDLMKEYTDSDKLKHLKLLKDSQAYKPNERNEETMTKIYTNMKVEEHIKENLVYNPPVVAEVLNDLYSTMLEQRENEILVKVSQQIGIDIDKERFLKAMNADKELYSLQQKNDFLEHCLSRACKLLHGVANANVAYTLDIKERTPMDWRVYIVDEQIRADNAMRNLVSNEVLNEENDEDDE